MQDQQAQSKAAPDSSDDSPCRLEAVPAAARTDGSVWADFDAEQLSSKERLTRIASTIESEVIPRLVQSHRSAAANDAVHRKVPGAESKAMASGSAPLTVAARQPDAEEVAAFVAHINDSTEAQVGDAVQRFRDRGMSVESLYLDLFAPAARLLGEMWKDDLCDFSTVTVGLGRLQRLLRQWSPVFGVEMEHAPNGRRILLVQQPDEQHSFGLSMVGEFFRRDGWEVLGGVAGAVTDPVLRVRSDWFDVVGFSIGSELRLDWLKAQIVNVRKHARNDAMVVLVGGPLFTLYPNLVAEVGADASASDGSQAPALAEQLMVKGLAAL
jgi:MerR family transcriptional regulator, light-induced transcriptional regulator